MYCYGSEQCELLRNMLRSIEELLFICYNDHLEVVNTLRIKVLTGVCHRIKSSNIDSLLRNEDNQQSVTRIPLKLSG